MDDFRNNQRLALASILDSVNWTPSEITPIDITQSATGLATEFPIADMACAALSAVGLIAADIFHRKTGVSQKIAIDRHAASIAMSAINYLRVDGEVSGAWDPLTRYFRTNDNEWIYLHTGFEHLKAGLLHLLSTDNDPDAVSKAMSNWSGHVFEDEAIKRGLTAARLRTRDEWQKHPQCDVLKTHDLIRLRQIGESKPVPFAGSAPTRPLDGVRVLDFSRVIAGPTAGRTLAEHGATVLRVAGPDLPFIPGLVIDTGAGKHSCFIDLNTTQGRDQLTRLVKSADIFLDGYRPGSLASRGFSNETLATLRPGIIYLSLSAFSNEGPWQGRRGYDTLVQATTGLARADGSDEQPRRLPCQPLDYLSGYLLAFGAMVALARRAILGGSWQVEMSLARTANWVWEMHDTMQLETTPPGVNTSFDDAREYLFESKTDFGRVESLAPIVKLSETPSGFSRPPVPLGTHPPEWP